MAVALQSFIQSRQNTEKNFIQSSFSSTENQLQSQTNKQTSSLSENVPTQLAIENFPGELEMLRQQSSQSSLLIDAMPTGLVMLDGNGIVIKINPVARLLLDEPILGQPWFDVIRRSFEPRKDDWHEVSLKDGRRVKLEIRTLGGQPGQLIVITDLTETRLLQDKLSQMQRFSSLGRMVSTLAHQIRTPLSAAMLYSANLSNDKLTLRDRSSFQDKLLGRLKDLEQQVNDMLLYAKSGNQQVLSVLNVNELIAESVSALEAQTIKSNAIITLQPCPNNCQILGNQRALTGAIQNLIHNSLQLIPQNAQITINTQCHDDFVMINVKDNGKGIEKTLADKIFEPFFTARSQGTGLGLAVVKSVANAHKGDVFLLSKPNEGAHFCIKLPLFINKENQGEINQDKKSQNAHLQPITRVVVGEVI